MTVVGFAIEGPSQAKIECEDQNDGSCDVKYWPTEPGEYAVHVMCDDEDIEDSPFMAHIIPDNKANNVDLVSWSSGFFFGDNIPVEYIHLITGKVIHLELKLFWLMIVRCKISHLRYVLCSQVCLLVVLHPQNN